MPGEHKRRRYGTAAGGKRVLIVPFNGVDGFMVRWTGPCPECIDETGVVIGCNECGGTGKRRREEWVPLNQENFDLALQKIAE